MEDVLFTRDSYLYACILDELDGSCTATPTNFTFRHNMGNIICGPFPTRLAPATPHAGCGRGGAGSDEESCGTAAGAERQSTCPLIPPPNAPRSELLPLSCAPIHLKPASPQLTHTWT